MEVVYEVFREVQAQNTDDIMSANTETLENDVYNSNGLSSNHYNLRQCDKPSSKYNFA